MGSRMASDGGTGMSRALKAALDLVLQPWLVYNVQEWPELGLDAPILTPLDKSYWLIPSNSGMYGRGQPRHEVEGMLPWCLTRRIDVDRLWYEPDPDYDRILTGWLFRYNRRLLRRYAVTLTLEAALS